MEKNKVYTGDCLEVLKGVESGSVDLTVTSPPYDNLRTYGGYTFDFEGIAKELYRVTKEGGVVVWVVGDQTINGSETGTSFKQALFFKDIGFNLHDTMIWIKSAIFPHDIKTHRYKQQFEYMFIFSKGKPKTFNPIKDVRNNSYGKQIKAHGGRKKNGELRGAERKIEISEFRIRNNHWILNQETNKNHPAIFPEKLAVEHIRSWSNEGDLVLDPMCGSGTTCKMALLNNRNYIGIELNPEYVKIAEGRLRATTPSLFLSQQREKGE